MAHVQNFLSFNDNNILLAESCHALERKRLQDIIHQWNSSQLDLFEISEPDQDLVFHGVMRFYLQDNTTGEYATKCIRISNISTTQDVIQTLLGKLRPNISNEPSPYAMYEVCGDKERKMDLNERPLMSQLGCNDKPNCFILKNDNMMVLQNNCLDGKEKLNVMQNFERTLSKKQKSKKENIKEHTNGSLLQKGTLLMNSGMKRKNNQEQKIDTVSNPSKAEINSAMSENCMIKNELKSGRGKNQSLLRMSGILLKRTGRTECPEQPYDMGIECITPKEYQTFEPQNKSNVAENLGLEWHLPLRIKLQEKKEDAFLRAVVNYTNSSTVHFKLSPAYVFYLASRFVLAQSQQKSKPPQNPAQKVVTFINKIVHLTDNVIQKQRNIAVALAFWMANASEFLNFIRHDSNLTRITLHSQEALAQLVQKTFKYLSQRLLADLESHLPAFFFKVGQQSGQAGDIDSVLTSLSRTMSLLRRCRVNPALSIQLFSQLFHFIGAWLLNRLTMASADTSLCSRLWGTTLRQRLSHVETWAERQGLELAADCHLSRIIQASTLLIMNSCSIKDAEKIHSSCFKLNSLQLRALMTKYHYAPMQPPIPQDLIKSVVSMAENTENEILRKEGVGIRIEEELELTLPFLLPEEGFSCGSIQGIPQGFQEFLEPICRKGLCTLVPQPNSIGSWTVYFQTSDYSTLKRSHCKPEVVKITLTKPVQSGMGISIVAAKGASQDDLGIFIKSVVSGGAANVDGRLKQGDQLLSVDGKSLIGVSQERAADILLNTGSTVNLEIARLGAVHYGLEEVLNQLPQTASNGQELQPLLNHILHLPDSNSETAGQQSDDLEIDDRQSLTLCAPSTLRGMRGNNHTLNRTMKQQDQTWLKHRLEYRSNPNLSYPLQNSEEMAVDSIVHKQITSSFSTDNLNSTEESECFFSNVGRVQRIQYQHLRQVHSQENICNSNRAGPLEDSEQCSNKWSDQASAEQKISRPDPRKKNGYWKTISVHSMPVSQPKRIDVPLLSPTKTLSFAALHHPVLARDIMNINLRAYGQVVNPQANSSLHSCHLPKQKSSMQVPKMYNPTNNNQKEKVCSEAQAMTCHSKSEVNQSKMSPSQICHPSGHHRCSNFMESSLHYAVDGPSPDPWKREARKQLERQQRHRALDMLEKEMLQLQVKVPQTLEETERLRRLSLEWQFQKRLQEFQQNGDEDEEEEEEFIIQQPNAISSKQTQEPQNRDAKEDCTKDGISDQCSETKIQRVRICPREFNHKSFQKVKDPENLTFRERQQLFSLAMSKASKVA